LVFTNKLNNIVDIVPMDIAHSIFDELRLFANENANKSPNPVPTLYTVVATDRTAARLESGVF